ncbi:hypothetical protein A3N37_00215 [Enterobacter ludwigii]|uniref:hypothetical protein n=1 Tax=Enterobacter ludwigii TaxID=299767 RepID=UPI0007B3E0D5|nr:hypothetical protein [Enterobacter ludwigii]KZP59625.1 hypothetical protein A3N37_00215 [Enterobacter ludwigii]
MAVEKQKKEQPEEPIKTKKCFIIMPIADNPDYEPGHFNRVYEYLIKPACINAGYEPCRADDSKASHMIMFDILKKIMECDMAICDLSSKNANVFYELGLRQAFNKKTILITDGKDKPPFDIAGFRYVPYNPSLRIDSVQIEINRISEMLHETENAPEDDVNSIVKLLQIQPAAVESINLNKEESVIYNMLLSLQKQVSTLSASTRKNVEDYGISLPSTLMNKRRISERKTPPRNASGFSFFDIVKEYPELMYDYAYTYEDTDIGKLISLDNDYAYFGSKNDKTQFPNDYNVLDKIFVK